MIRAIYFRHQQVLNIYEVKLHTCDTDEKKEVTREDAFFTYSEARKHLTSLRRAWLIDEFIKYVKHKSILFRSSPGDHYRVPERLNALTRLENAIEMVGNMETEKLCKTIISAASLLSQILPHPKNPSYPESKTMILQLSSVSNDELNDVHGIFSFNSKTEKYFTHLDEKILLEC